MVQMMKIIKKVKMWFYVRKLRKRFENNELSISDLVNILMGVVIDEEIKKVFKKQIYDKLKDKKGGEWWK